MTPSNPVPPDLSVVLDLETMKITGNILFDHQVSLWLQAAREIAPRTFELIICTRQQEALSNSNPSPEVKIIQGSGKGYYALKNEGGAAASGEIIFFTDVDCRPTPGFLVRLMDYYARTRADIVGGRSFYDGKDFASRICTVVSFGRLHGVDEVPPKEWYLAHNVSVRRSAFPELFGPYTGRFCGDEYITNSARRRGLPLPVPQELILYHESAAHTLRGLLDRHLREIIRAALVQYGEKTTPWDVVKEAWTIGRNRWLIFKRRLPRFQFSRLERERARWHFKMYQIFDVVVTLDFLLRPHLLSRWIADHLGDVSQFAPVRQVDSALLPQPGGAHAGTAT